TMTGTLDVRAAEGFARRQLDSHAMTVIVQQVEHLSVGRIETMHQDRVINIGSGATINAPVTIAETIQGSFNTIDESAADDELKRALRELATAVAEAARAASPEQAEHMASDLETVTREATRSTPRASWVRVGLDSLREAAQALGEIGLPIIEIA